MKAASVTITLGLVLISGALLAATATSTDGNGIEDRARAEFERLDQNDDHRISRREAEPNPGLATHFAKFDRDSDGILDWREFLQHESLNATGSRQSGN